ncbi:MAG: hypothetical protein K6G70_10020 [Bacteroidaceae bacterium]|nr:hypothetical protein [Bacteroidaceae bacterium]
MREKAYRYERNGFSLAFYFMTDVLPASTAQCAKETEAITLVPMGAARLRIAAFPCTSE